MYRYRKSYKDFSHICLFLFVYFAYFSSFFTVVLTILNIRDILFNRNCKNYSGGFYNDNQANAARGQQYNTSVFI